MSTHTSTAGQIPRPFATACYKGDPAHVGLSETASQITAADLVKYNFAATTYCPNPERAAEFKRLAAEASRRHDRAVSGVCPDCGCNLTADGRCRALP
jgi:hypothetical protein